MIYSVMFLGLLMLISQIDGNPVMTRTKQWVGDMSEFEIPKSKDWITFTPAWSFPSFTTMNRMFRNVDIDSNEIKLLKKRMDSLERGLMRISQSKSMNKNCQCKTLAEEINSKLQTNSKEVAIKSFPYTIISTTPTTTINHIVEDEELSTLSKIDERETTSLESLIESTSNKKDSI